MKEIKYKEAKEYLREYQVLFFKAERVKASLEELKRVAYTPNTTSIIAMNCSARETQNEFNKKHLNDLINDILDLESKYINKLNTLNNKMESIDKMISKLLSNTQKKIVLLKYIGNERFEKIAVDLKISYRQVLRINDKALSKIQNEIIRKERT
ncbi:MAG TPA: hypothetical protein GX708_01160 [Gallicola sp.]|nr:hypothetical protein [Gallicola sp.]